MTEQEQNIRMRLQFNGEDSPCNDCPVSLALRIDAIRSFGGNLQELTQYCGYQYWLDGIAEAHQTVIFVDENGKPKIRENLTFSGKKPADCKLI